MGCWLSTDSVRSGAQRHEFSITAANQQANFFLADSFTEDVFSFSALYLLDERQLLLYLTSYLPSAVTLRFVVELTHAAGTVTSTAVFMRRRNLCVFCDLDLPLTLRVSSASRTPLASDVRFVGITNVGLICYVSSSLQLLACVSPFVQLMFDQSINARDSPIAWKLQQLFATMKSSSSPVSVASLIDAFGRAEMLEGEQDAEEFLLTLFDRLDRELGPDFRNSRLSIFGVTLRRMIDCPAVGVRRETDEDSNDVQIAVAGFQNLEESLAVMGSGEELTGDSQWDTGQFGRQDAVQSFCFTRLPPFLLFHLCRFAYNADANATREVRTRFDCPDEIDLRRFSVPAIAGETKYVMVAVIAHRAKWFGGHYVAYIRPAVDSHWFIFNDSTVSRAAPRSVEDLFGRRNAIAESTFLAYIVGYVRRDAIDDLKRSPMPTTKTIANCHSARFLFPGELYGHGKVVEWNDALATVEDLAESNCDRWTVFVAFAKTRKLIGPVSAQSPATMFALQGCLTEFVFVPREEDDNPVFFVRPGNPPEIIARDRLLHDYCKLYELRCDGVVVNADTPIERGAVVSGIEISDITLSIDGGEITVSPTAMYQDLQNIVDPDFPARVVFMRGRTMLLPDRYPTAADLVGLTLTHRILEHGATANSVGLFLDLTIELFDVHKIRTTHSNFLVSAKTPVRSFTESVRTEFGFDDSTFFAVSAYANRAVGRLFHSHETLPNCRIRVDCARSEIPRQVDDYRRAGPDQACWNVEVREARGTHQFRTVRTLGFHEFKTEETVGEFVSRFRGTLKVGLEQEDDRAITKQLHEGDLLLKEIATFKCRERPVVVITLGDT